MFLAALLKHPHKDTEGKSSILEQNFSWETLIVFTTEQKAAAGRLLYLLHCICRRFGKRVTMKVQIMVGCKNKSVILTVKLC